MRNVIDIDLAMTFLSANTLVLIVEDTLDYFQHDEPAVIRTAALRALVDRMDTTEINAMLAAVGLKLEYTVEKA